MFHTEEKSCARQYFVMDPIDTDPSLPMSSLVLALSLASEKGLPLGINATVSLIKEMLKDFSPQLFKNYSELGEVDLNSVKLVDMTDISKMITFSGIILFVGIDQARFKSISQAEHPSPFVLVPQTWDDLENIVATCPNAVRARLDTPVERMDFSDPQKKRLKWFCDRYVLLAHQTFDPQSSTLHLGAGQEKVCRYCGETRSELFRNASHAFPEQIGNKKLIDSLECDACNTHFGKILDDHYGKWSLPVRSTSRIKGKANRVPTYKSADEKIRIAKEGDDGLKIGVLQGDERVSFDLESKKLKLQFDRQPYVPMAIFKSFVKMALAVMPDSESLECSHLKKWVLEIEHTYESFRYSPLTLYVQFIPGPLPNNNVTYFLFKRKQDLRGCPYMLFVIQYANYVYQIVLPFPEHDSPEVHGPLKFQYFCHPWDTEEHERQYGLTKRFQEDLSSTGVLKGDSFPITFAFDSAAKTYAKS